MKRRRSLPLQGGQFCLGAFSLPLSTRTLRGEPAPVSRSLTTNLDAPDPLTQQESPLSRYRKTPSMKKAAASQCAIEEVYWRHRIWPKENARSKPSLDEVMSSAEIEQKSKTICANRQALEDYWQRRSPLSNYKRRWSGLPVIPSSPRCCGKSWQHFGNSFASKLSIT
jgi:hypothetical protein